MPVPNPDRLLIALYGPTSSGKTALSVEVATRIERDLGRQVVVISADSRQVYRHMDIGTSKTTPAEMRGIRHEMIDVAEPIRKLELEAYAAMARDHIAKAFAAGQAPFIVGGTGVYVRALLEGWDLDRVGDARAGLRRDFPRSMVRDAHAMLRRLDRAAASRVHPNNYEAVINALAGLMTQERGGSAGRDSANILLLGLDPGARVVERRVARTYDDQVRRGLLDEIERLDHRYGLSREMRKGRLNSDNQVLHTHGYREYFEVAWERGKSVDALTGSDLAEVRSRVVEHIQRYTRRQRSWFRKLTGVRMVRSPGQAFALVAERLSAHR